MTVREWAELDDGTTCTRRSTVTVPPGQTADEVRTEYDERLYRTYERSWVEGNHSDTCPGEEDDAPAVPAITSRQVMAVFEGQVDRPEPAILPGRMLTGLTSYLQTGRALEHDATITVAGRTLDVRATATFMVDWGDGTVTGPHDTPGEPYPDGTVTHVYTDKGIYDVQVIDTWTMEWRFQGGVWSAPADTQMAPVTIDDFVVREYRAVRVTPQG